MNHKKIKLKPKKKKKSKEDLFLETFNAKWERYRNARHSMEVDVNVARNAALDFFYEGMHYAECQM